MIERDILFSMKRAVLEFNYEAVWNEIFGKYANEVDVLEGLKCFKCDAEGLIIISRVRLIDKKMVLKQLLRGNGLLKNIELLYKEEDGSLVVFIEGKSCVPSSSKNAQFNVISAHPPEFLDKDKMKIEVVGNEKDIQKFLQYSATLKNVPSKLLGLTSLQPRPESYLSKLTLKQRQAIITAYGLGYYDVPRRVSSEGVSKHLDVDKSTFVEHLRKAERKLV
ncbi:MAG: helix-turn-helix domain-containing protein, partial [Nitrososphaeraceae archaeon]